MYYSGCGLSICCVLCLYNRHNLYLPLPSLFPIYMYLSLSFSLSSLRLSLSLFLKVFNTTTLPESITIPIMMDTWTKQMGYPVIHVTISSNGKTLSYQQERFLQNPLPSNGQVAPSPYGLVSYYSSTYICTCTCTC